MSLPGRRNVPTSSTPPFPRSQYPPNSPTTAIDPTVTTTVRWPGARRNAACVDDLQSTSTRRRSLPTSSTSLPNPHNGNSDNGHTSTAMAQEHWGARHKDGRTQRAPCESTTASNNALRASRRDRRRSRAFYPYAHRLRRPQGRGRERAGAASRRSPAIDSSLHRNGGRRRRQDDGPTIEQQEEPLARSRNIPTSSKPGQSTSSNIVEAPELTESNQQNLPLRAIIRTRRPSVTPLAGSRYIPTSLKQGQQARNNAIKTPKLTGRNRQKLPFLAIAVGVASCRQREDSADCSCRRFRGE